MEERLMLIDYDNSEFGTRAWDLAYYVIRFYEKFNTDIYEDFLNAYLREYNRIGVRQFSYEGLTFKGLTLCSLNLSDFRT